MDWLGLNQDHKLLKDDIAEFAKNELEPELQDYDKKSEPLKDAWKKASQLGLFGIILPEKVGGAEMDFLSLAICIEELSAVSPSFGLSVAIQNITGYVIDKFYDSQRKIEILSDLIKGKLCGLNIENGNLLEYDKDNSLVSGKTGFIVNGLQSQYLLLFQIGQLINNVMLLNTDEGFIFHKENELIGMRSAGIGEFEINSVKVEPSFLIDVDRRVMNNILELCASAIGVGISQGCLVHSAKYAKERKQFGRAIAEFGMVREMLSEIVKNVRASRLLLYDAAEKLGDELAIKIASSFSREKAMISADKAVQIFGGYGYTRDYPVEMFFRDAKALEVMFGSVNQENEIIGKLIIETK